MAVGLGRGIARTVDRPPSPSAARTQGGEGRGAPMRVEPVQAGRLGTAFDGVELPLALATLVSDPQQIRGLSAFEKLWKADVHHYTRGELFIVVNSVKAPADVLYAAEIQVVGFVAGIPDLIASLTVNSASSPAKVPFALGDSAYDYVQVNGRQMIDGLPNGDGNPVRDLSAVIVARLYR